MAGVEVLGPIGPISILPADDERGDGRFLVTFPIDAEHVGAAFLGHAALYGCMIDGRGAAGVDHLGQNVVELHLGSGGWLPETLLDLRDIAREVVVTLWRPAN